MRPDNHGESMANILIIDDEDFIRSKVRKVLERDSHTVTEASGGIEGKHLIEDNQYDLIILDIIMPDKGGIDILLEEQHQMNSVKVILMTGQFPEDTSGLNFMTRHLHVNDILYKPFRKQELLDAVSSALAS
jgi:DNA-binding NtrC family response regulator